MAPWLLTRNCITHLITLTTLTTNLSFATHRLGTNSSLSYVFVLSSPVWIQHIATVVRNHLTSSHQCLTIDIRTIERWYCQSQYDCRSSSGWQKTPSFMTLCRNILPSHNGMHFGKSDHAYDCWVHDYRWLTVWMNRIRALIVLHLEMSCEFVLNFRMSVLWQFNSIWNVVVRTLGGDWRTSSRGLLNIHSG